MSAIPKLNSGEEAFVFWCKTLKLPPPCRNFRFCSRKWDIDFAWPEKKIGVEIQGGIYTRQAHGSISGILRDMAKHNALIDGGWRVWEFTPKEATDGTAAQKMREVLES